MRHRSVDGDDQIERADGGGGFGKILELRAEILDRRFAFELFQIGGAWTVLHADEIRAGDVEQRRQHFQIDRAAGVVDVLRIAGPDEADLEALQSGKPLLPFPRRLRGRAQIRHIGWNGFEPGSQQPRQAQKHGVALIGRDGAAIAENLDAGQALAQQHDKLLVDAQRHFAGARREQGNVARELQRIAKALLGLDINVLAGKAVAPPGHFGKFRPGALGRTQPPFVFVPAFAELAAHQKKNA